MLDGIGDGLASAGQVAFGAAMSLGQAALAQQVQGAVDQPDAAFRQVAVSKVAKMVAGQMLGRMHGVVQQEVDKAYGQTTGINGDAGIPTPWPEKEVAGAIESTMNDPRNAGIFDKVADEIVILHEPVRPLGWDVASHVAHPIGKAKGFEEVVVHL